MFDAVVTVGASVALALGAVAMLNVAMTSKTKLMQAWSMMYIFAMLSAVAASFETWIEPGSVLQIVPNVAAVGTVAGLWCGCRIFNARRAPLLIMAVFLLATGVVGALELPERGEWAGAPVTMAAVIILAIASARECLRGDLVKLVNGRIVTIVCLAGAAWTTARLVAYTIVGQAHPIFVENFNPTTTALVSLSGFACVALTTAMLTAARTGAGAVRAPAAPTFSLGVLDWDAFVPGARDRTARVRAHGENTAVLVVEINRLEEINITYGAPYGDEAIRKLASFLREQLYPTTIIGHRGAGRFVIVGLATDAHEAERRAFELLDALVTVTVSGKKGFRLDVSIGTSDSFVEEHNFDALLEAATAACARARARAGSRVETSAEGTAALARSGRPQPASKLEA